MVTAMSRDPVAMDVVGRDPMVVMVVAGDVDFSAMRAGACAEGGKKDKTARQMAKMNNFIFLLLLLGFGYSSKDIIVL